jgi:hypothetical protein
MAIDPQITEQLVRLHSEDAGVRLNIRPFMNAELRTGGKKDAGVLRWKPNIRWDKDRGKEPRSLRPKVDFPWFWSCNDTATDFAGGNRWNDLHYTDKIKEAARNAAAERETEKVKV